MSNSIFTISDERVKKNLIESSYSDDLQILTNLKTYDYDYIDQKFQKKSTRKGIIAQELEQIYPNAIKQCSDYVPNIYKIGSVNGKILSVEFEEDEDIKIGSKIKLMIYRIENDEGEVCEMIIENIQDNKIILTDEIDMRIFYDELFVVGTRVDDFRNVSNDDILFISVGAIKQLKTENDELKSALTLILSRLDVLENM